jgi:hypothetical protein
MPLTDLQGGGFTGRQMHILAFAKPQTMGEDGAKEPGCRTVVEHVWRIKGFKPEIVDSEEWPWLARMRCPSRLRANRCLSFVAMTSAMSSRVKCRPAAEESRINSSTEAQPGWSSVSPMRSGLCLRTKLRNLLTFMYWFFIFFTCKRFSRLNNMSIPGYACIIYSSRM